MKTLFLIRHAKSSWDDPSLDDFDRPLNARGKKNAPFMGKVLKKKKVKPDLIVSSPAVRAYKTAVAMAKELDYPKDKIIPEPLIYEASVRTLLKVVCAFPDTCSTIFLFGHNPGLTDFANYLTGARIANVPTTGMVEINFPVDTWKMVSSDLGELMNFDFPKNYS